MERSDWVSDLRYWHGLESRTNRARALAVVKGRLRGSRGWWTILYVVIVLNMLALTVVALLQRFS